jgi:hypothetical protein
MLLGNNVSTNGVTMDIETLKGKLFTCTETNLDSEDYDEDEYDDMYIGTVGIVTSVERCDGEWVGELLLPDGDTMEFVIYDDSDYLNVSMSSGNLYFYPVE